MKIHISQTVSLADQKIEISVSGLPPGKKLILRTNMCLPWAENVFFGSKAEFITGEDGCVDLSKQAPAHGDYMSADSMGLITSMKLVSGKINAVGENISVDNSLFIDITAECEGEKVIVKIERLFMSPEVKTEKISKPFIGAFYYSENPKNKTVLLLGGSGGKLCNNLPIASLLASHGFNVLTVAYFSEPGLPKDLVAVPLEYFDNVFDWLANNPYTKDKDLYLHCTSKGGELGLILASKHDRFTKIAAFAPHAYCFQGISFTKKSSSWTYQKKQLPFIRMKYSTFFANIFGCIIRNEPFGYTYIYKTALSNARNKEEARIKVENSNADLLLFSGKRNNIWNAYDGCVEIINTLDKAGYKHGYKHISYENAGEPFYAPYILPAALYEPMKIAPRLSFFAGGTLMGNNEAVINSWEKMLDFFGSVPVTPDKLLGTKKKDDVLNTAIRLPL
jgi:hypothetical protein